MWGADLTAFKTNCAVSTLCNPADWIDYDGWALGATINFPMKLGEPDNGFCFDSTNFCTLGYYGAFGGARVYTADLTKYGGSDYNSPNHDSLIAAPELSQNFGFNTWGSWAHVIKDREVDGFTSFAWRFIPYGES